MDDNGPNGQGIEFTNSPNIFNDILAVVSPTQNSDQRKKLKKSNGKLTIEPPTLGKRAPIQDL